MRRLGVHTSISGGLHLSVERAYALGCTTMQIFSHNPRQWALKRISEEEITQFKYLRANYDISPLYIHASYLINIASNNQILRNKSINMIISEMDMADKIGAEYVILHTGSSSQNNIKISRKRAIKALNEVAQIKKWKAGLLIENTAGERGDISYRIIDLSEIMNSVKGLISGICIDTCHAFAAGYNIRYEKGLEKILHETEMYIGFDMVKLIHLNDSKRDNGSRIDRHEHIGLGKIGIKGLQMFINCKPLKDVPLILETPKKTDYDDYANLEKIRKMIK